MKNNTQKSSTRILYTALAASLFLHLMVYLFGYSKNEKLPPPALAFNVKAKIIFNPVSKSKSRQADTRIPDKLAIGRQRSAAFDPKKNDKITSRYADLLPKAWDSEGSSSRNEQELSHEQPILLENGMPVADQENARDAATHIRESSWLTKIARFVIENFHVPPSLRKLDQESSVEFIWQQNKHKTWELSQLVGDPYMRALIFEVFAQLKSDSLEQLLIKDSDLNRVRISIAYHHVSDLNDAVPPLAWHINGNQITINYNFKEESRLWNTVMASPANLPAVNVFGIAMLAIAPLLTSDPREDGDLIRLRGSPAFSRPIK